MHAGAFACFASNTGSAGLMLYSNPPAVFVFGGVNGYAPGWDGFRNSLAKMKGYQTELIQPNPVLGPYEQTTEDALKRLREML